jgi:hypothetical protein
MRLRTFAARYVLWLVFRYPDTANLVFREFPWLASIFNRIRENELRRL